MNGVGPDTVVVAVQPKIVDTVTTAAIVLGVLGILGCVIFRKKH